MVKFLRFLLVCACVASCPASDFADRLFKEGQKAERAGDNVHAYLLYARASALDPKNPTYAAKKAALRGIAMVSAREELGPDPAASTEAPVETEAPSAAELEEARESLPPPRLKGSDEKKSFDLKGDARDIFEKVAAAYGLLVVFEADYQSPPHFTFRMTDVGYVEALRALETQANSFLIAVNDRLAMVMRDTPQKRTERSQTMAIAIPIPERMSVQDAQELLTAVQQTLEIRRAVTDPTRHLVLMRDQVGKVLAARQMFYNLSQIRPQVAVDVELLLVDKTFSLNAGISLPNQLSVSNFQGALSLPNALRVIERLTGSATPFGLAITQASVFATLARSSATTLLDAQVVTVDGQAATLNVGDRYPIATNQYIGNTSGVGQVYTPPPTINFEDLGLVLKLTPSVNDDNDVSLDIDAEFKELGATAVNGIPIISNNKYAGKVRLKEGEWAVIAGLVQKLQTDTKTGIPGLADIPFLGRLFSQNQIEKDTSDVLLVLKPHLTTLAPWDRVVKPIWVGTESRPLTVY
jgi:general secretion pathway protein D